MKVGCLGGRGRAGVDDDNPGSALFLRREQALEQNRMAPGEIGAHENHQIGKLQVLVNAWHSIRAKRALMPATEDDMHRRELVSMFAEPMKPFISLLAT